MERWEQWVPIDHIPQPIYLDSLVDGHEGIVMRFSSEDSEKKVLVQFDGVVCSYRNTDEGRLLKTWDFLSRHYGDQFYSTWPLFKVKHSEYLNWFLKESAGIYEDIEVTHYVFITPHDVVDVLSTFAPRVMIE
ncbi:hypothetical protein SAMN04488112_1179 [Melghirimyces thermohalophilus]|uniref:Uncharacterized protein n=1 Tax=Melghirimyces thermohalophilus TaxID=1236220 RepID=A0A1G6PJM2_9BACL|nr:hypothetical protein [Melghirimyces thermohalophilus]SDC80442.1 hypothetical protein SAMN04488112_1179 [Melghirimyces thermohalophilus]